MFCYLDTALQVATGLCFEWANQFEGMLGRLLRSNCAHMMRRGTFQASFSQSRSAVTHSSVSVAAGADYLRITPNTLTPDFQRTKNNLYLQVKASAARYPAPLAVSAEKAASVRDADQPTQQVLQTWQSLRVVLINTESATILTAGNLYSKISG